MNSKQVLRRTGVSCVALLAMATAAHAQPAGSADLDKAYVASTCRSDLNVVKLSRLALDKSTNPDVKSLAQQMITGHTTLEQQIKPFADQWGIAQPSSLDTGQQALYDKLSALSGKDFDKQYVKTMNEIHHDLQTRLMTETATTKDMAFKPQVESARKVINQLTSSTDRMARKLGLTPVGADVTSI
jgi:putative membrane protein